jgi:16S rRNA (guanine966-N2)-methyltransferase
MRVIAGKMRGRILKAGENFRPTTDRARETLFNILQAEIAGSTFVDAFAGSGSVGIEAISRSAARVYFVESNRKALKILEQNLLECCHEETWRIFTMDVWKALEVLPKDADLLYFDPPYEFEKYSKLLVAAGENFPHALYVVEHSSRKRIETPSGFELRRTTRIGETEISFYRKLADDPGVEVLY